MPNWKTYESSVRLLSAIVAAHPGLKLNYDDLAKAYGSDCTKTGLVAHFQRDITPNVKAIRDALDQNKDTKNIVLVEGVRNGKPGKGQSNTHAFCHTRYTFSFCLPCCYFNLVIEVLELIFDLEVAACFGSNVTKSGLTHCFHRNIQPNVKLIRDARKQSVDPKDITMVENVRDGQPGKAIAREYGDGVTGGDGNGGPVKKTPVKRGSRAKKAAPAFNGKRMGSSGDDDEEEVSFNTPSKKTPLNKVKGGRVAKASGGRAKAPVSYAEPSDEDDDEMEMVKQERDVGSGFEDINHNAHNGNGNGTSSFEDPSFSQGYAEGDEAKDYYDAEEENYEV